MPPSWRAGSWLLYFLIQVNYLTAFAFNLVLGNPATRDNDLITIFCLAGEMRFCWIGPDSYTLSLRLVGGNHAYNLTMVLRTTPFEPQERPTSQAGTIEELAPLASSIPPLPVHTPANTQIVPVKTGSTPRGNSESWSYLTTFRTWLHRVWCALASIVLGVLKLVGGSEKVGGAWLSCKANRREVKMKGLLRRR